MSRVGIAEGSLRYGTRNNRSEKCFACNKPMPNSQKIAYCEDEQYVYVGPECFKKIEAAGASGYQPPLGGPKLFAKPQHNHYPNT